MPLLALHSFLLGLLSGGAGASVVVSRIGTTVHPNYVRHEGKKSYPCPSTHPYSFNGGLSCCASYVRHDGCPDTGLLQFGDDSSCCYTGDTWTCPDDVVNDGRLCKSTKLESASPAECDDWYPTTYLFGSRCCENVRRSDACPSGAGGPLDVDDPEECCDGDSISCDTVSSPCTHVTDLVCMSHAPMPHADALNYCESNAMLKSGISTIADLNGYFGAFEEALISNSTNEVWLGLTATADPATVIGDCADEQCDGDFVFDGDAAAPYSFAASGIRLTHQGERSGCLAAYFSAGDNEPVLDDRPCQEDRYVLCMCSPSSY